MTKLTGVILVCVISAFSLSFFSKEIKDGLTIKAEPATSFGTILGTSSETNATVLAENREKAQIMKNILAQDFEEARKRMEEFYQKTGNKQEVEDAGNSQTDTIERLRGFITTPSPTLHPRLEKILAETSKKDYEEVAENQPANFIGEILVNPRKTHYTIALLGDSMIDTLGKELPHLRDLLTKAYSDYTFNLLNYGQGGTDLDSGLFRLTNSTNYLEENYPSLLSRKVDILIVESFAYNHWSGQFYDLDRQWLTIAKIIDTVKSNSPGTKIILAATIAPNTKTFGDGKLNWPAQLKWDSATITKGYLQNVINFATSEHYPLVDAYHPSMDENGDGREVYINQSDHLHPSNEGALLFSQKILEVIKQNNLIQ